MTTPSASNLERFERAGIPVALFNERERAVFEGLSQAEADLILEIKARLDTAGPEVQAHGPVAGGALF